jgi:hypothetical protein
MRDTADTPNPDAESIHGLWQEGTFLSVGDGMKVTNLLFYIK